MFSGVTSGVALARGFDVERVCTQWLLPALSPETGTGRRIRMPFFQDGRGISYFLSTPPIPTRGRGSRRFPEQQTRASGSRARGMSPCSPRILRARQQGGRVGRGPAPAAWAAQRLSVCGTGARWGGGGTFSGGRSGTLSTRTSVTGFVGDHPEW